MGERSRRHLRIVSSGHLFFFFFQAEDGIRDLTVTGVQTCALPISLQRAFRWRRGLLDSHICGERCGRKRIPTWNMWKRLLATLAPDSGHIVASRLSDRKSVV